MAHDYNKAENVASKISAAIRQRPYGVFLNIASMAADMALMAISESKNCGIKKGYENGN